MKTTLILALSSCFAFGAQAATLQLQGGEVATINPNVATTVSCAADAGTTPQQQSAVEKICGHENYNGGCDYFNESTLTGRYCVTAKSCGHQNYTGGCDYFNTKAACGEKTCTVQKACGHQNYNGGCDYFNETVSCT